MSESWPLADRPSAAVTAERTRVAQAVAVGDAAIVRAAVTHREDRVRSSALRGLVKLGEFDLVSRPALLRDESHRVRRTIAELGASVAAVQLEVLLDDTDSTVIEAACWSAGERGGRAGELVDKLADLAVSHGDSLCREAAVAALGAIGSPDGLPAILAATRDRATVRRRAVLALAPFDSPEVSAALADALRDRDWQVRQAAEDLS